MNFMCLLLYSLQLSTAGGIYIVAVHDFCFCTHLPVFKSTSLKKICFFLYSTIFCVALINVLLSLHLFEYLLTHSLYYYNNYLYLFNKVSLLIKLKDVTK